MIRERYRRTGRGSRGHSRRQRVYIIRTFASATGGQAAEAADIPVGNGLSSGRIFRLGYGAWGRGVSGARPNSQPHEFAWAFIESSRNRDYRWAPGGAVDRLAAGRI